MRNSIQVSVFCQRSISPLMGGAAAFYALRRTYTAIVSPTTKTPTKCILEKPPWRERVLPIVKCKKITFTFTLVHEKNYYWL
jgi:hypothetical protein